MSHKYSPKYNPDFVDMLPSMFENGESVVEVCQALGVSKRAFYYWVEQYPDFAEAYKKGKEASESWWNKLGRNGASGASDIQPTVWIFNMKNRFNWRDKTEQEISGPGGAPLNTNLTVQFVDTDRDNDDS